MVSVLEKLKLKNHLLEIQENTRAVRETEKHAAMAHETGKVIVKYLHSTNERSGKTSADLEALFQALRTGMGPPCILFSFGIIE